MSFHLFVGDMLQGGVEVAGVEESGDKGAEEAAVEESRDFRIFLL